MPLVAITIIAISTTAHAAPPSRAAWLGASACCADGVAASMADHTDGGKSALPVARVTARTAATCMSSVIVTGTSFQPCDAGAGPVNLRGLHCAPMACAPPKVLQSAQ